MMSNHFIYNLDLDIYFFGLIINVIDTFGSFAYTSFKFLSLNVNVNSLYVPSYILTNFSNDGLYVIFAPNVASEIDIESSISDGVVHLLEIKVQCIRSELIVDPTGVKVDKAFPLVVVCDDGNAPEAKPIIFLIDPKDAKTNCGV